MPAAPPTLQRHTHPNGVHDLQRGVPLPPPVEHARLAGAAADALHEGAPHALWGSEGRGGWVCGAVSVLGKLSAQAGGQAGRHRQTPGVPRARHAQAGPPQTS